MLGRTAVSITWEQRKFSDYYRMISGYAFKMSDYCEEGIALINGESIQHGIISDNNLNYLPESFIKQYQDFVLREGDIVVGLNRPITNGNLKIARIPGKYNNSLLYQRAGKIVYKEDCDKNFSYVLLSQEILKHTLVEAVGSDQPFISTSKLDKWQMMIPMDIEEQYKLGEYFTNLDHLITLHQRKCIMLYYNRKYAWEQRKLGEIAERVTRKNQDLVSTLPLTISAQYGLIDQTDFFDKRVASKDISNYYLVNKGEFAYNKSTSNDAPWGAIKRLDRYENGVLSTLYIVFRIRNKEETNSDYLVSYYDTVLWHKGIHEIAAEGARNHGLLNIAPFDFFNTCLAIPQDIEEQKKIGNYFKSLDRLITLHHHKCNYAYYVMKLATNVLTYIKENEYA